jgi:hypothetical protein
VFAPRLFAQITAHPRFKINISANAARVTVEKSVLPQDSHADVRTKSRTGIMDLLAAPGQRRRPLNFDFLINPSYWWASRYP